MLVSSYESILDKRPKLEFKRKFVIAFTPYTYYNVNVNQALREVESLLKILPQQNYQLFIVNTEIPYLRLPRTSNRKKNQIIDRVEEELNRKVSFRKLGFYLCFDEKFETIKSQLSSIFSEVRDGKKELFSQLAALFGGIEKEPFFYPLERTEEGFRIEGKRENSRACVLFEYRTPQRAVQFGLSHILANSSSDFLYILSFYRPSPFEYEQLVEKMKKRYAEKGTESGAEVAAELNRVLTDIINERELLYYYTSVLVLFGNDGKELKDKAAKLIGQIQSLTSQQFTNESGTGLTVFKSAINFSENDKNRLKSMKLMRRITLSSFTYMFPVLKHTEGRKDRFGAVYINASGEPVFISQHNSTGHKLTVGSTGSGKSVDETWMSLFEDVTVFVEYIQEDTGSYKVFTQLVEGEDAYFPVSLDRPVSVNPFGKHIYKLSADTLCRKLGIDYRIFDEPDIIALETALSRFVPDTHQESVTVSRKEIEQVFEEDEIPPIVRELILPKLTEVELPLEFDRDRQAFIAAILQSMVGGQFGVEKDEVNYISQLVVRVYRNHDGKRELTVNDFYSSALLDETETAKKVADGLFPFTSDGEFAGFFDRPTDFKRGFMTMFIELRTLQAEVLNPVMLSILKHLLQTLSSPKYQKFTRRVILDEGWTIFKNPLLRDFLESALRTFRKKGIAIDFASQSLDETTSFLVGQTEIRYFKFLDQKDVLERFSFLTDDDKEAITSIKKPKDYGYRYSVSLVETKSFGKGIIYLVQPDFYYWISTTDPKDKLLRLQYYNRHKDLWKAVLELARDSGGAG